MGCSLWPVSIGAFLKVCFKYRFNYQFHCSLYNPVFNGRYTQLTGLTVCFGYFLNPVSDWLVRVIDQFLLYALQEVLHSCLFNIIEGHSINTRCSIISFDHLISLLKSALLAYMHIESPEAVGFVSLRLDVYLPFQFLQCDRRF